GLVFQSYALFPHMTVAENIAFGLEMRKLPAADMAKRVGEAMDMVRLQGLGERLPRQLSGGQQQRVALARALAVRPDVLLLDEPLSNLDAKLRAEVRVEIRELQQRLGLTTLMVTHDQEEALTMADRLVVMNAGRVCQIGSQRDLYERPADRFVAGFVGRSNFITGEVGADGVFRTPGGLTLDLGGRREPAGAATFAIRPEQVRIATKAQEWKNLAPGSGERFNPMTGRVLLVSFLGAACDVHVALTGGERIVASLAGAAEDALPKVGDEIMIGWPGEGGLILRD
ncbi:MAG: ABC transporter ATP-binding protein, partial [Beijerinckiaceae bacterium]